MAGWWNNSNVEPRVDDCEIRPWICERGIINHETAKLDLHIISNETFSMIMFKLWPNCEIETLVYLLVYRPNCNPKFRGVIRHKRR